MILHDLMIYYITFIIAAHMEIVALFRIKKHLCPGESAASARRSQGRASCRHIINHHIFRNILRCVAAKMPPSAPGRFEI